VHIASTSIASEPSSIGLASTNSSSAPEYKQWDGHAHDSLFTKHTPVPREVDIMGEGEESCQ
jgi:hypothetical protein